MIRRYEEDGLETFRYDPERDGADALELEAQVVQGEGYALTFHRSTFHRRAENFRDWALFTGRIDGQLVGICGSALKPMTLLGEPAVARFTFDLRVHPDFRNRKIARRVAGEALQWRQDDGDFGYSWIVDDNRASQAVSNFWFAQPRAQYRYLVYPTYRVHPEGPTPRTCSMAEVHRQHVEHCGPFDVYCDPTEGNTGGHVQSWILERDGEVAGCSAWDNREILGEVVERIPGNLAVAGALFRAWPFRLARLPHIPRRGEALQSWYVFDCFATGPEVARDLFRFVSAQGRKAGIDYCYIVHDERDAWIGDVRADLPKAFAPILAYNFWSGWARREPFPELGRVYVDVRDL